MIDLLARAARNINLSDFKQPAKPIKIERREYTVPYDRQYILRMMIRTPSSGGFCIPDELEWLKSTILDLDTIQKNNNLRNEFVYVTVRHGLVTSETDDIWHVDGFSMRTPHLPEQNYIWTDIEPTEYAEQSFEFPEPFDPLKHNIHWYFDERVRSENIKRCEEKTIYMFDPYFIHRRPKTTAGMMRTFWRVSFIPIEIRDGQCQQNPLLPVQSYSDGDIRDRLTRWQSNEGV